MSARTALITCCDRYMGNAIKKQFEEIGITVIAGPTEMHSEQDVNEAIANAGDIDILVAKSCRASDDRTACRTSITRIGIACSIP